MKIGDIYWIKTNEEISHPQVIIKIEGKSLVVCGLTTNMKKISMPGNILLDPNEGNLEKQSIVEVSKELNIKSSDLDKYIGSLSSKRVEEILNGIGFIKRSFLH